MTSKRVKAKKTKKAGQFDWKAAYGISPGKPKAKNMLQYIRTHEGARRMIRAKLP